MFRHEDGFPRIESLRLSDLLLRYLVTSLGLNLGNFTIVLPQLYKCNNQLPIRIL